MSRLRRQILRALLHHQPFASINSRQLILQPLLSDVFTESVNQSCAERRNIARLARWW